MTVSEMKSQHESVATLKEIKYKKKNLIKYMLIDYQLYLIILLPLLWLIIFRYYPMYGAQIAFRKFIATEGIWGSPWVGFYHFTRFFNSYKFWDILINTLGLSLYQLIGGFPVPIILALSLNATEKLALKKTVQFATYMPHFISTVVMVGIIMQFLNPRIGIINVILKHLGGGSTNFMGIPNYFKSIYVWSGVWQTAGWGTIIYLAALAGIDTELHEAAMIDGASRFRRILHIDFPGILPTTVVLLILNTGRIMQLGFEKVYLMQNPLNLRASEVISTYVYKIGLASASADFSYSTAIGLFNSLVNLILIIAVNQVAKKLGETSLW